MSAFLSSVDQLIAQASGSGTLQQLQQAAMKVEGAMGPASVAERNDALGKLAHAMEAMAPFPAAQVAVVCGALVENGGDPMIAGRTILPLAEHTLDGAVEFDRLCRLKASADGTLDGAEDEDPPPPEELAEKYLPAIYEEAPEIAFMFQCEYNVSLAAIAHLSRSKPLRQIAREHPALLEKSLSHDRVYDGGHSFLTKMLLVLDDEPLLVLDTDQSKGYRVKISGMPDNFTLHTQLMGRLFGNPRDGWIEAEGIDMESIRYAMTHVCDQDAPTLSGAFDLWNWTGLKPDGTLPQGSMDAANFWIWNEGVPADIIPFEGLRIVVLGQPTYARHWRGGLVFAGMIPEFEVQEKLSKDVVQEWFKKLGKAPKPPERRVGFEG